MLVLEWCRRARQGDRRGEPRAADHRHRRRPGRAGARCWCCTTCWASGPGRKPRFVRNFMDERRRRIRRALRRYVAAVKDGSFRRPTSTPTERLPAMQVIHTIAELRARAPGHGDRASCPRWATCTKAISRSCAGAPPARRSCASIFVNRLQFAPHEDFDRYPRTLRARLRAARARRLRHAVRAGRARPVSASRQTFFVQAGRRLADILEGEFRPGFFTGVCTVVLKLFNCVQPSRRGLRQEGLPAADW